MAVLHTHKLTGALATVQTVEGGFRGGRIESGLAIDLELHMLALSQRYVVETLCLSLRCKRDRFQDGLQLSRGLTEFSFGMLTEQP